jgi:hypothetical protein
MGIGQRAYAAVRARMPHDWRASVGDTVERYGEWTSGLRLVPFFLIVGAQRSGTNSLYEYLVQHPGVMRALPQQEVHYFDLHFDRGLPWYQGHFATRAWAAATAARVGRAVLTGESSPYYMFHPLAPERIASTLPDVRLIVLLRDPVDRAYSQYCDQVSFEQESLPFEEALAKEPERLRGEAERILAEPRYVSDAHYRYSYLARGRYLEQLERWLEHFPREQLLVVGLEELLERPGQVVSSICGFLGVPSRPLPPFPSVNRKTYEPMRPETRASLESYFQEHNERLYEFLGRDLGWSRPAVRTHA